MSQSHLKELAKIFYSKQYKVLKYYALWELSEDASPRSKFLYRLYFWYFILFGLVLFDFALIMQLIVNIDNVEEVIRVLLIFATALAVMGKYLYVKLRNRYWEEIFANLCDEEFLPRNIEEKFIFLKAIRHSTKVRNFYATLSISALCALFMSQFISDEKELPASIYIPMELNTNLKYTIMYIYQCLSMSILCFLNVAFDSLVASFFINIKCQLDMLGYRLENIGRGKGGATMCQESILRQLKDCIVYYQHILQLTQNMEDALSIPISIQIGCSVFVLIANFYAMSLLSGTEDMANFFKFSLYQTCMLVQIFILCFYANDVSMKSSEISFNLYSSNWYEWNKINRKMVLLMMLRFETPIRIKSINSCYSFNLAAFTSIVNSSYSYFALLKNINS